MDGIYTRISDPMGKCPAPVNCVRGKIFILLPFISPKSFIIFGRTGNKPSGLKYFSIQSKTHDIIENVFRA